jgi:hypothetical protein
MLGSVVLKVWWDMGFRVVVIGIHPYSILGITL